MNAADQQLLSGALNHYISSSSGKVEQEGPRGTGSAPESPKLTPEGASVEARVPVVEVDFVHTAHLLPHQSKLVEASIDSSDGNTLSTTTT